MIIPPVTVDPPLQRTFKRLINRYFTPAAVAPWEPATARPGHAPHRRLRRARRVRLHGVVRPAAAGPRLLRPRAPRPGRRPRAGERLGDPRLAHRRPAVGRRPRRPRHVDRRVPRPPAGGGPAGRRRRRRARGRDRRPADQRPRGHRRRHAPRARRPRDHRRRARDGHAALLRAPRDPRAAPGAARAHPRRGRGAAAPRRVVHLHRSHRPPRHRARRSAGASRGAGDDLLGVGQPRRGRVRRRRRLRPRTATPTGTSPSAPGPIAAPGRTWPA